MQGACRVLSLYWELIPTATRSDLLQTIIADMSRDASAAAVRAAVFKGLAFVIDNHLTQV